MFNGSMHLCDIEIFSGGNYLFLNETVIINAIFYWIVYNITNINLK